MSPILRLLLEVQLTSDPFYGADTPQRIYGLTLIAGSPETPLALATEATRECNRMLREECAGLVLSRADGSNLVSDLKGLPRARAAIESRSLASSTLLWQSRQRGAE